jgi:hypothetical protein
MVIAQIVAKKVCFRLSSSAIGFLPLSYQSLGLIREIRLVAPQRSAAEKSVVQFHLVATSPGYGQSVFPLNLAFSLGAGQNSSCPW